MRYATVIPSLVLLALTGCGGGDATGPDEPYPPVAGQWEVHATFDDLPANLAFIQGTIQITQATRSAAALGGTWTFTATVGGDVISGSGIVFQGSTTTAGDITLLLTEPAATTSWTLTGRVTGNTVAGRHTLSDGMDSFSGNWTGQRVASVAAQRSASDATTTTLPEVETYRRR